MKKLFSLFGLLYFLFDFIESLAYDLLPALTSSETIAYKAGFVFGNFLTLLAIIGCGYWTYYFFTQESDSSKALT